MHRAVTSAERHASLPRGLVILGLALASWALVAGGMNVVSGLFNFISASF